MGVHLLCEGEAAHGLAELNPRHHGWGVSNPKSQCGLGECGCPGGGRHDPQPSDKTRGLPRFQGLQTFSNTQTSVAGSPTDTSNSRGHKIEPITNPPVSPSPVMSVSDVKDCSDLLFPPHPQVLIEPALFPAGPALAKPPLTATISFLCSELRGGPWAQGLVKNPYFNCPQISSLNTSSGPSARHP